jgi:signal transduction histidine kinase
VQAHATELGWPTGHILSQRLFGITEDLRGDYRQAIPHYLACLDLSRQIGNRPYESSALSDLGYDHYLIKNFRQSKDYYFQAAQLTDGENAPGKFITNYSNLGAAYNSLDMPDSALYCFNQALGKANRVHKTEGLASLLNNIGNAWYHKGDFAKSITFFRESLAASLKSGDQESVWLGYLNLGDAFNKMRRFDSSRIFLDKALDLARKLGSSRKEGDVEKVNAEYYSALGDYKGAYGALSRWESIDSTYVNTETRNTMFELEQRFHAREREAENKLLQSQVEREVLRSRVISLLALAILAIALAIGVSRYLIRRKNDKLKEQNELIQAQNQRLAELNAEKNSLISVVSHDLSGPFTTIRMWLQLLDRKNLDAEQVRAIDRIQQSADNGEKLIRDILVVERAETNRQMLEIEPLPLSPFLCELTREYIPLAEKKGVGLFYHGAPGQVMIMSDRSLAGRIFGNLLSNAIKFTASGKEVHMDLQEEGNSVIVSIRDEGVGIPAHEIGSLFTKYAKISSRPTAGEHSTGLGLSIVKRLVDELGGQISCKSVVGQGSTFTVVMKK